MKTLRTLAMIGIAGLVAAPAVAQETTIQPGWWESANTLNLVISNTERERRCITPKDVDKILSGRINRHYTCTYPEKRVAGGKMYFKGTCVDKRGRTVNVTASGNYSATAFNLDAKLSGKLGGVPISASASTSAKRIGDVCPAKVQKLK
ncbi:MAG: DUF3617 family protein [Caulobacter sp.]|jgi:hypothetical protein|nr:DUF3617 family protein [Caulobacter sp.]